MFILPYVGFLPTLAGFAVSLCGSSWEVISYNITSANQAFQLVELTRIENLAWRIIIQTFMSRPLFILYGLSIELMINFDGSCQHLCTCLESTVTRFKYDGQYHSFFYFSLVFCNEKSRNCMSVSLLHTTCLARDSCYTHIMELGCVLCGLFKSKLGSWEQVVTPYGHYLLKELMDLSLYCCLLLWS